ncbi:unnamed protein product [Calicophoron daubneyi]|uniref:EF-hand domain-containing protein n=1 Tax=Calicophoron daubneyi TaxID=300641 RepID=A0AAV2TL39_CALDB
MQKTMDLEARFRQLDINGDGVISKQEFRIELERSRLPLRMVDRLMKTYDSDGDGFVTLAEYTKTLIEEKQKMCGTTIGSRKPQKCSQLKRALQCDSSKLKL